jgi:pimeloyl-ACP methyl ester carboxylesterase
VTTTALRPAVGTAVLLPGTGSDDVFVQTVFAGPLAAAGLRLVAPVPAHGSGLVRRQLADLDAAADRYGPIVAGGISLGAHVAAEWAAANPSRCAGLLLAMPGWLGDPTDAPGALTAGAGAAAVDADGLAATLAAATADVPDWLADELRRAWTRAGAALADSLRVAVDRPAPTADVLRAITVPVGVAGCVDDPVHPIGTATEWAAALPAAELRTITLAELGADRAALGRAALAGLGVRMRLRMPDQIGDDDPDDHGGGAAAQRERCHHAPDRYQGGQHDDRHQPG